MSGAAKKVPVAPLRAVVTARWHHIGGEPPFCVVKVSFERRDNESTFGAPVRTAAGDVLLRDLAIVAHFSARGCMGGSWFEYAQPHTIRESDATAMMSSFRAIRRRMDRLVDRFGGADGFVAFLSRAFDVLGVEVVELTGSFVGLIDPADLAAKSDLPVRAAYSWIRLAETRTCTPKTASA